MKTIRVSIQTTDFGSHSNMRGLVSIVLLFLLLAMMEGVEGNGISGIDSLPPPEEVHVESVSESSITVSWKSPRTPSSHSSDVKVFAYVVVCSPVGIHSHNEREVLLPPSKNSATISDLERGKQYSIVLSAVYTGYTRSAAPKLVVATKARQRSMSEVAVRDEMNSAKDSDCNCSAVGMLACTRSSHRYKCTCYPGYEGTWCETCSFGYLRVEKECLPCPCSNITSTGQCKIGPTEELSCKSCLPGHRGPYCRSCSAGYHWKEERCQPVNCLSFSLCAEVKDSPGCSDCIFLEEGMPPTAQKSNAERTIADGTVPLIAVIVTLAFIVLVAAFATCYRYWSRQRTRPRLPFFSIELREEKVNLGSDCQYQHLDAASSRAVTQTGLSSTTVAVSTLDGSCESKLDGITVNLAKG